MTVRRLLVVTLALAAAGCTSDRSPPFDPARLDNGRWRPAHYLGAGALQVVAPAVAGTRDTVSEPQVEPLRKTLGGKVLTAMALERATGRKPDPSRLTELD